MNSVGSNRLTLKYQRFTPSGCNDLGFRKFEIVSKIPFEPERRYLKKIPKPQKNVSFLLVYFVTYDKFYA